MKRSFLLAGCVAASLSLFACGDDSSSAPNNVDRDTIESSNDNDDSSSSSVEESSSSEAPESSSSAPGVRAATMDDFSKHMVIKGLFGKDISFAAGSKHGTFSLWVPGDGYEDAWMVINTDFKDGVINVAGSTVSYATTESGAATDSLVRFAGSKDKLSFIVDEETEKLLCVYNGDTLDVETEKVKVKDKTITSGDSLAGKRLSCDRGDTTDVYSFYDGTYMLSHVVGDSATPHDKWSTGYYDIQRSRLLLLTAYMSKSARALTTLEVSDAYALTTVSGTKTECKMETFKYTNLDASKLAGEWDGTEGDASWTLNLKSDGKFKALSNEGRTDSREGAWDVFGDLLVLEVQGCMDVACLSVVGTVSDFDAAKGFSFKYTASYADDGKTHPGELPYAWKAPQYE